MVCCFSSQQLESHSCFLWPCGSVDTVKKESLSESGSLRSSRLVTCFWWIELTDDDNVNVFSWIHCYCLFFYRCSSDLSSRRTGFRATRNRQVERLKSEWPEWLNNHLSLIPCWLFKGWAVVFHLGLTNSWTGPFWLRWKSLSQTSGWPSRCGRREELMLPKRIVIFEICQSFEFHMWFC